MKKGRLVFRLLPAWLLMAVLLAGCGQPNLSALIPKGPVADMQLDLMWLSLVIMIIVVLVVSGIFIYVLIRFRARPGQEDEIPEQVEGNTKLEILWTVIPIILLMILAVPTVMQTFTLAKDYSEVEGTVKVKVTAHQFWWEFDYPDYEIKTSQDLYIPVGKKVQIELTSADVIHSFWVPALAGKTDTNPGLQNDMWLQADEPGIYKGKCAELCGSSHALMDFKVIAVTQEEFDQWVEDFKEPSPEPTTALAQEGKQIFEQNCLGCHAVDGKGGNIGPVLTGYGEREAIAGYIVGENREDALKKWLTEGQKVKPGNKMPDQSHLTEQQLDALSEYLLNLEY